MNLPISEPDGHALIVGASSDIGLAICRRLAERYSHLTATYRDAERLAAVVEACGPSKLKALRHDVSERGGPELAAYLDADESPPVQTLVYAVGTLDRAESADLDDGEWDRVLDVNLSGPFRTARTVLPYLADGGSIVFIGSTAHRQAAGPAAYVSSKAALRALAKSLARTESGRRIRANTIEPGFVDTRFEGDGPERAVRARHIGSMVPARRLATTDEVAEAVATAALHPYLTGATLTVAGGAVMD